MEYGSSAYGDADFAGSGDANDAFGDAGEIHVIGVYSDTINVVGSYTPTIDLTGERDGA